MSIYLTPIGSDNFSRVNEKPLSQNGNWVVDTHGDPSLQIVSDLCESAGTGLESTAGTELYTGVIVPNDQYASMTIGPTFTNSCNPRVCIRGSDNGSSYYQLPAYQFAVSSTGQWTLSTASNNEIASGSGLTINTGDVFTVAAIGTTIYAFQNSTQLAAVTDATYASGTTILMVYIAFGGSNSNCQISNWVVGSASLTATYSISGNAGVASATVSYSGQATGSVTADGSGNYTISGLANGSYTITPSLAGYTFSPTSQNETVSGANITGVNFTATAGGNAWSPVDSRVHKPNFATYRVVNGAQLDDVQTSSNPAIPPSDDRKAGAPSQDGTYPQNSRTAPPF